MLSSLPLFARTLEKKLKEVADLKALKAGGATLDADQESKLAKEPSIRKMLDASNAGAGGASTGAASTGADTRPTKMRKVEHGASTVQAPAPTPQRSSAGGSGSGAAAAARVIGGPSSSVTCGYCSRKGHEAKNCSFGVFPDERFLRCAGSASPCACFSRTFVVPLRRAAADFDPMAPRESGRADVGLRCVTAGLFRSQSLRRNSMVMLCFGAQAEAEAAAAAAQGGGGGGGGGGEGGESGESGAGQRILDVHGSMVRGLRQEEIDLAR